MLIPNPKQKLKKVDQDDLKKKIFWKYYVCLHRLARVGLFVLEGKLDLYSFGYAEVKTVLAKQSRNGAESILLPSY